MKYLIAALVVLALLFLVWWLSSRGKQRKLEEQRTEAARIRAGAGAHDSTIRGQETFAQQADERAAVARQEAEERARQAEESAREAQRVEEEARRHQAELERTRQARDAELRRADELDPDVEVADDDPRPLPEDLDDDVRPLHDTDGRRDDAFGTDRDDRRDGLRGTDRDEDYRSRGTEAMVGGSGAAAVGSAYAASRGDVSDDEAARLAAGEGYGDDTSSTYRPASGRDDRDPVGREDPDSAGVYGEDPPEQGRATSTGGGVATGDTAYRGESTGGWTDRDQGTERQGDDMSEPQDEVARDRDDQLTDRDRTDELHRSDDERDHATSDESADHGHDGDMAIIGDVEEYASTEPLPMEAQSPAPEHVTERAEHADARDEGQGRDEMRGDDRDELRGDDQREDRDLDRGDDRREDRDLDRGDVRDEGDGSDDQRERSGERGDATHWADGTERVNSVDDDGDDTDRRDDGREDQDGGHGGGRRTAGVEEIRDGGFGVGSAAPFDDGAQPLDHPVQAYRDTMTYRVPGVGGYDSAEPDVWFYDEDAARRAGFTPSEG